MTIGRSNNAASDTRDSVSWNVERGPNNGRNCFGCTWRDAGHSRVPAPPHMISGIIRLSIAPRTSFTTDGCDSCAAPCPGASLAAVMRGPQYPFARYCQIGAKNIPRRPKSGVTAGIASPPLLPDERGRYAPDTAFSPQNTDFRGAAVFRVAQDQFLRPGIALRHREPGLDRPCDRRDIPADFSRRVALARDQCGLRRAAGDNAGVSLQPDRDVLQSDPAVLDRRRRGAAVAGRTRRRRMARGDLFHLCR